LLLLFIALIAFGIHLKNNNNKKNPCILSGTLANSILDLGRCLIILDLSAPSWLGGPAENHFNDYIGGKGGVRYSNIVGGM
jgi:hypothetical protein